MKTTAADVRPAPGRPSFSEYVEIDAINWSTLKHMRKSPLHYHHALLHRRADTGFFAKGRAIHAMVFEPDTVVRDFAVFDGPRRAGRAWDAFEEENAGKTILKRDEFDACFEAALAVRSNPLAAQYLREGVFESTIQWTDRETGLACKGRLDWLSSAPPVILDLKSLADAEMRALQQATARHDYHCQLAFYRRGCRALGLPVERVVMVWIERDAPHDVTVTTLDEDSLYLGDEEVTELLRRVAQCRETGQWPGRYQQEQLLSLPTWRFEDDDETDATGLDLMVNGRALNGE